MTAHSWALLVRVSRELLADGQNVSAVLEGVMSRVAALALDQAILFGTGSSNQPTGITNTSGISTASMGVNGATPASYADILNAILALQTANSNTVSAMLMHPRSARTYNGLVNTLGDAMRMPPVLQDIPGIHQHLVFRDGNAGHRDDMQ